MLCRTRNGMGWLEMVRNFEQAQVYPIRGRVRVPVLSHFFI